MLLLEASQSMFCTFLLLAELQKWKRKEGDQAGQNNERPHSFALRLQNYRIKFNRTLLPATRENYDERVKTF